MSVVIPVSAVTGVALSVLCGVFFLGDRPTPPAWLGICVTVPALWPVAAGRLAAVVLLLPTALRYVPEFRQPRKRLGQAAVIGAGAALGLILYLWAAQQQMLAVAVVLASLYPAIPTVLGLALLREKVPPAQVTGLLSAGAAVILLNLG
ncbi:EamA family transporter [Streptomyces sp. ISL-99]|uniref:EamA family transporter n=1 Tax=Streptomyces sp. ISL-99 TaxID=2819193 RepID=UPI002035DBA6|nr:EamA family transporter [Streptomyces sp. ISL-99]